MNMASVVTALAPLQAQHGWKHVGEALSLNAVPDWSRMPAAFVHPLKETALDGNQLGAHAHRQIVTENFAVVIVCPLAELEQRRDEVRNTLLPGPLQDRQWQTNYVEGEVLDLDRTTIWWRETYSTQVLRSHT